MVKKHPRTFKNVPPYERMEIERKWAMPDKRTFDIKPIRKLIERHHISVTEWIDPFPYPYKKDALEYLSEFKDNSVEGILFDPPYSPRQLKEMYGGIGLAYNTKSSYWSNIKNEIARIMKKDGIVISFGWNSMGIGKTRGFKIEEILLVPHGGNHNDTICVVEIKK